MIKRVLLLAISFAGYLAAGAQQKWDLQKCVAYAIANNISVRQTDLQSKFSELTYQQNKSSQYPTLSFGNSNSFRLGRSENPSTGVLEDNNLFSQGFQLSTGVSIFNWFSKKNSIEADRLTVEADNAQTKKIQDDIALNVAVAYLQVLLSKEQINIAKVQVSQTQAQLENTRKRVNAGVLPELNAAELEAQLARDSSNLIGNEATVRQSILQLKALLNLDAAADFDLDTPPVDKIPIESLGELQPAAVYALALANLSQQKVNELRLLSAKKNVEVAKGQLYPTISAFGSLGTNYVHFKSRPIYNPVFSGYDTTTGIRAKAGGGIFYPVDVPIFKPGTTVIGSIKADKYGSQLNTNFGQSVGISINVPIFNGRIARTNWERSKLNVKQLELTKEQDNQKLKQDIYKAYNDAAAALQKFNANKKTVETSAKSYDFASKRYNLNLLSTYDLINSQNNLQRAKIELLVAQYDYVFKMKLLEFYKGQGLKL
jgi:outer membrane protein